MTPQEFCYWLQGFFEISGENKITEEQARVIKDHLALVFEKRTPDRGLTKEDFDKAIQDRIEELEEGAKPWNNPMQPWNPLPSNPTIPYPWENPQIIC